ncbi:MAG TPA: polysaccharide deacetylase family protein [Vicinamibacterales bacterium]|nr:polysaccharide deacetylase family protein [Vicinamibacterales bacterium]
MGNRCLAVMYHYVRDSDATPFPAIRALPPALFEQQLDWLQEQYHVISLDELLAAIERAAPLPADAAILTFDDGFVDHYTTVWPILRRRGIGGVFYLAQLPYGTTPRVLGVHKVHFLLARLGAEGFAAALARECHPTAGRADAADGRIFGIDSWEHADERTLKNLLNYELPLETAERVLDALFDRWIGPEESFARELYLSESMVAEMAATGMAFGYHTRSHRMLSRLTVDQQQCELRDGVGWIKALTGQSHVSFCYPWGGPRTYTTDTTTILRDCGYTAAFTSVRRRVDLDADRRFELPRVDTRDLPPYTSAPHASPEPS